VTLHFVHVLNALVHKSSDLLGFNQTHNAATFSSKCKTFALQVAYITPSLVGPFCVKSETWYFFAN